MTINKKDSIIKKAKSQVKEEKANLKKNEKTGSEKYTEKAKQSYKKLRDSYLKIKKSGSKMIKSGFDKKEVLEYIYASSILQLYIYAIKNILSINANSLSISGYLEILSKVIKKEAIYLGKVRNIAVKALLKTPAYSVKLGYLGKSNNPDTVATNLKKEISNKTAAAWEEFKEKIIGNEENLKALTKLMINVYKAEHELIVSKTADGKEVIKNVEPAKLAKLISNNVELIKKELDKMGMGSDLKFVIAVNYALRGMIFGRNNDIAKELVQNKIKLFAKRQGPNLMALIEDMKADLQSLSIFQTEENKKLAGYFDKIEQLLYKITINPKFDKTDVKALLTDLEKFSVEGGIAYKTSVFGEQTGGNGVGKLTEIDLIKLAGGSGRRAYRHIDELIFEGGKGIKFEALGVKALKENMSDGLKIIKKSMDPTKIKNAFILLKYEALRDNLKIYEKIKNDIVDTISKQLQEQIIKNEGTKEGKLLEKEKEKIKSKEKKLTDTLSRQTSSDNVENAKKLAEITSGSSVIDVFYVEEKVGDEVISKITLKMDVNQNNDVNNNKSEIFEETEGFGIVKGKGYDYIDKNGKILSETKKKK